MCAICSKMKHLILFQTRRAVSTKWNPLSRHLLKNNNLADPSIINQASFSNICQPISQSSLKRMKHIIPGYVSQHRLLWYSIERREAMSSVGMVGQSQDGSSSYHALQPPRRLIHTSGLGMTSKDDDFAISGLFEDNVDDADYYDKNGGLGEMYTDEYLEPQAGHRVILIHPVMKSRQRSSSAEDDNSSINHQIAESAALVECLPNWSIVAIKQFSVKRPQSVTLFTKGIYHDVRMFIRDTRGKTAVFVNMSMLNGLQLSTLQKAWGVPVYDRYTIILQIFRLRARTKEAKLQVALAEIPYYRSRFRGMTEGSLNQQRGGLNYIGGSGETWADTRMVILSAKERAIRQKLVDLKTKREIHREERKKRELPLVAVVGYTNAGKTSLIKVLTREARLQPRDQLFATLDVTCHAGYLGNHMKVIYIDTVGFISNIPTSLIESFAATLDDIRSADAIIHVRDISHPETEAQKQTVLRTLSGLGLENYLLDSIIEIRNKSDLLHSDEQPESVDGITVSTVTGLGLAELRSSLEGVVIHNTGRSIRRLRIPQSGPHLAWLYKEATVQSSRPCDQDSESLLVEVIMTNTAYNRFCAKFRRKKTN